MKILKKSLIYDIENMAYVIADNHDHSDNAIHRLRDICQDGNIDRVSRILGLAYSRLLTILFPILSPPLFDVNRDYSQIPHDYEFRFRTDRQLRFLLTKERQFHIKEAAHEYMVAMVLADWLEVTMPQAADVWKFKAENALSTLTDTMLEISSSGACAFRRKISPI